MATLKTIQKSPSFSLYQIEEASRQNIKRFVVSTPETRAICNDPLVYGVNYTEKLKAACTKVLISFRSRSIVQLSEKSTCVLHVLRGGLNYGLRDALFNAYGWTRHASAFISAQRARKSDNPEDWYITESDYKKLCIPCQASVVFGDVVGTGTSLLYALEQTLSAVKDTAGSIEQFIFFTIGTYKAELNMEEIDNLCRALNPGYKGFTVVYFEGRFDLASVDHQLSIKYTGTDILRSNALLAPEFIESQYENPAHPIERCAIYDAGSRAFWLPEYLDDVKDYWTKTLALAHQGMTFTKLLKERFPELDSMRFGHQDLVAICKQQLQQLENSY